MICALICSQNDVIVGHRRCIVASTRTAALLLLVVVPIIAVKERIYGVLSLEVYVGDQSLGGEGRCPPCGHRRRHTFAWIAAAVALRGTRSCCHLAVCCLGRCHSTEGCQGVSQVELARRRCRQAVG